jgi:hypothetical protein
MCVKVAHKIYHPGRDIGDCGGIISYKEGVNLRLEHKEASLGAA